LKIKRPAAVASAPRQAWPKLWGCSSRSYPRGDRCAQDRACGAWRGVGPSWGVNRRSNLAL